MFGGAAVADVIDAALVALLGIQILQPELIAPSEHAHSPSLPGFGGRVVKLSIQAAV